MDQSPITMLDTSCCSPYFEPPFVIYKVAPPKSPKSARPIRSKEPTSVTEREPNTARGNYTARSPPKLHSDYIERTHNFEELDKEYQHKFEVMQRQQNPLPVYQRDNLFWWQKSMQQRKLEQIKKEQKIYEAEKKRLEERKQKLAQERMRIRIQQQERAKARAAAH